MTSTQRGVGTAMRLAIHAYLCVLGLLALFGAVLVALRAVGLVRAVYPVELS